MNIFHKNLMCLLMLLGSFSCLRPDAFGFLVVASKAFNDDDGKFTTQHNRIEEIAGAYPDKREQIV
jgi:hypothetical protein